MVASCFSLVLSQIPAKMPALTARSSWSEVVGFLVLGLVIVLLTLAGLSLLCALLGYCFQRWQPAARTAPATAHAAKGSSEPSIAGSVDPDLLAVIAAAVTVVLEDQAHRILRIMPAYAPGESNPWGGEGRRQIFASHAYPQQRDTRDMRQPADRARGLRWRTTKKHPR